MKSDRVEDMDMDSESFERIGAQPILAWLDQSGPQIPDSALDSITETLYKNDVQYAHSHLLESKSGLFDVQQH